MTTIRIALVFLITATVAFAQNGNSNSKVRTAWVVEFPDTQLLAPFSDNLGHIAVAGSHTNFPYAALFDDKGRMSAETFLSTPLTVQAATSGSDGSIYLSGRPNGIGAIPATVIATRLQPGLADVAWTQVYTITNNAVQIPRNAQVLTMSLGDNGAVYISGNYRPNTIGTGYFSFALDDNGPLWVHRGIEPSLYVFSIGSPPFDGQSLYSVSYFEVLANGQVHPILTRLLPNGEVAWMTSQVSSNNPTERFLASTTDSAGNLIVTGWRSDQAYFPPSQYDYFTAKLSPAGDVLWTATFGDTNTFDYAYGVTVDADDNVYVTGSSGTLKYSSAGQQAWFSSEPGQDIEVAPDGGVVISGTLAGNNTSNQVQTAKLDINGMLQWRTTYGSPDVNTALAGLHLDADGGIFITVNTPTRAALIHYVDKGNKGRGRR